MKHANTRALYDYWDALRLTRPAPLRSELDPRKIKAQLANVFILQRKSADEYTFRLAGTELCHLFGRELRDTNFLSDWRRHELKSVRSLFDSIIEERTAAVLGVTATNADEVQAALEYVFLPVRLDSTREIRIFGCCSTIDAPSRIASSGIVRQEVASLRLLWPDNVSRFMDKDAAPAPEAAQPAESAEKRGHLWVIDGGAG